MDLTQEEQLLSGPGGDTPRQHDRLAYTILELVRYTGAGRSKIYEELAAGRLKARKLGKRTLVLHGDAMAWLQSLPAELLLPPPGKKKAALADTQRDQAAA